MARFTLGGYDTSGPLSVLEAQNYDGGNLYMPDEIRELLLYDGETCSGVTGIPGGIWWTMSGRCFHSARKPRILSDDFRQPWIDRRHTIVRSDHPSAHVELVQGSHLGELALTAAAWSGPACFLRPAEAPVVCEFRAMLSATDAVRVFVGLSPNLPDPSLHLASGSVGFSWGEADYLGAWRCLSQRSAPDAADPEGRYSPTAYRYQKLKLAVTKDGTARFYIDGHFVGDVAAAVDREALFVPVAIIEPRGSDRRTLTLDYCAAK